MKEGISLDRYEALAGKPLSPHTLANLRDLGMIEPLGEKLIVSNQGVMIPNTIIETQLAD